MARNGNSTKPPAAKKKPSPKPAAKQAATGARSRPQPAAKPRRTAAVKPGTATKKPAARTAAAARSGKPPAAERRASARRSTAAVKPIPEPAARPKRAGAVKTRARAVKAAIGAAVTAVAATLARVVAPKGKARTASRRTRSVPPPAAPAAEPARAPLAEESFTFPESYGRTRVRLLMQSPGRLFVHWDLSPGVIEELKAQLGRRAASLARLAIRITTADGGRPVLVLLPKGARNWYVDVPSHRQEYQAELGLMLPSGEFRPLAATAPLRMPRTSPSPVAATRKVAFSATEPPAPDLGEDLPADVLSEEERAEWEARSEVVAEVIDAEAVPESGGSSEMSGGASRRRTRKPGAGGEERGGSSDLSGRGSSSDLRPRR